VINQNEESNTIFHPPKTKKKKKKKYKEQETRSREPTTALLFKAPKEDKICKLY